jgi:hypothetical protein
MLTLRIVEMKLTSPCIPPLQAQISDLVPAEPGDLEHALAGLH